MSIRLHIIHFNKLYHDFANDGDGYDYGPDSAEHWSKAKLLEKKASREQRKIEYTWWDVSM